MKKIKYYIFFLLGMASLASCSDELTENVSMNVSVQTENGVTVQSDVVTVKAGTPVVFNFSGDPDNISFWSGEEGSAYANKDRLMLNPDDVVSSKLHFKLWAQYGKPASAKDVLHMYISDHFQGLAGNDFKADSVLVESFDWINFEPELTDVNGNKATLPQAPVANANKATEYMVDIKKYFGSPITFAICYKGLDNTVNQSRMNFSEFYIENIMKSGAKTTLYAGDFGFTPINMMCHHDLDDQRSMTANREYGTVTNNTNGIWNFVNINNGAFFIQSSPALKELKYSWIVSNALVMNACSPDKGQTVKNMSQNIDSFTYTYNTPGEYKATFIGTNSNYKKETRVFRELTIKVVE